MDFGTTTSGMGITSIWDIIVFLIIARMFGFGGINGNGTTESAATATTVESAIRNALDTQNVNNRLDSLSSQQAETNCNIKLGAKDVEIGQLNLANQLQRQISDLQADTNQHFCDAEIRSLTQRLTAAETALNNCNQTAAFSAIVHGAVDPIANAVSSIMAQLNCGVKSIPYTASVPAALPAAAPYIPPYAPAPFCGDCGPCRNGFAY